VLALPRELNKPDSVIPDKPEPMSIPLGRNSRFGSSCLPESGLGLTIAFLFGIAPDKAFLATDVTIDTGGLLHRHFTLTQHSQALRGLFLWSWLCITAASG